MNPIDDGDLYDTFLLGGQRSPGVVTFEGLERDEGWETQKAKSASGGENVCNGPPPIKFRARIFIWRDHAVDHFRAWDLWRPILKAPVKEGQQQALDFYHPCAAEIELSAVVVGKHSPALPDGLGGANITIEFLEHRPSQAKQLGKVQGSRGGGFTGFSAFFGGGGLGGATSNGNGGGLDFGEPAGTKKTPTERVAKADPNAQKKARNKADEEEYAAISAAPSR